MYCLNCQAEVKCEYDRVMVTLGAVICVLIVSPLLWFDSILVKVGFFILGIAIGSLFVFKFQYRCPRCHKHNFDRLRLE